MSNGAGTAKSLGIAACTAVVVGNMVGSGFYLSPRAVAPYGVLAIVMWALMGAGAICLGLCFARLARVAPATGGPYAYTRMGYGDFAGFLIGWGYWVSIWASLPVIAIAFAGAVIDLVPEWRVRWIAIALTLGSMWLVVLVNLRGVKEAGIFASVTTYAKLIPFAAIAIIGLIYIEPANFSGGFNASGQPLFTAAAALAPLTMFAYLGLESATVPAGDVRDPHKTIPRATVLGISTAAILYVLGTAVVMGVVPREDLVTSVAPFTDAARIMWGQIGAGVITAAVIVSAIGALNGWTLLMGQVPMAAAQDKLFPSGFGRMSSRGVPAVGIVVSAAFATVLVLVQAKGGEGFDAFYNALVGLATMTAVVPYAFCALAIALIPASDKDKGKSHRLGVVEIVGFIFALFVLYGCGAEAVLYGLMLMMVGIPVYVWQQRRG
jgi:arginine:agmatine antiporter